MNNEHTNTQGQYGRGASQGKKLSINKETIRALEDPGSEGVVAKATGIRCPTARADTECCVVGDDGGQQS